MQIRIISWATGFTFIKALRTWKSTRASSAYTGLGTPKLSSPTKLEQPWVNISSSRRRCSSPNRSTRKLSQSSTGRTGSGGPDGARDPWAMMGLPLKTKPKPERNLRNQRFIVLQ
ncbi:ORFL99C [Human betaherpesvirus 5]|nr:ORFL99C [Human betaherpesvirus 5]QHX40410.1 ORFL99C [Human betaherpesvirus 5]